MDSREPRTPSTEELANDLYVTVVNPDLTWWDDLPPGMQEGWLRAAALVERRARAASEQAAELRRALLETAREVHAYGLISRHGYSEPFETCEDVYCVNARALSTDPAPSPAREPLAVAPFDFLAAKDRSMREYSDDRSKCPNCGEWRDSPDADCAECGYARLSDNP